MVAGAILAVLLTSISGSVSQIADFIAMQRLRRQAHLVGQSHMESLLAIEYERQLRPDDCTPVVYDGFSTGDDAGAFVASCRIVNDTPVRGAARLVVEVSGERKGRAVHSELATYVVTQ